MSKACVPGGQVPLRTLLLTSRYLSEQRRHEFQSLAYVAAMKFKTPTRSTKPTNGPSSSSGVSAAEDVDPLPGSCLLKHRTAAEHCPGPCYQAARAQLPNSVIRRYEHCGDAKLRRAYWDAQHPVRRLCPGEYCWHTVNRPCRGIFGDHSPGKRNAKASPSGTSWPRPIGGPLTADHEDPRR